MNDSIQYIYLLIEREFISLKKPIYKIGRTNQSNNNRLKQYPKGSILLFQTICNNSIEIETLLIRWFKIKFTHKPDIGNEYFEGDFKKMIQEIYDVCFKSLEKIVEFSNCNLEQEVSETDNKNEINRFQITMVPEISTTKITEIINPIIKSEPKKLSNSFKTQLFLAQKMLKIIDLEHPHNIGYIIQKSKILLFRKFYNKNKEVYNYAFNIEKELNILTILNIIFKECGNTRIKIIDNNYIIVNESNDIKTTVTSEYLTNSEGDSKSPRVVSFRDNEFNKHNWINELQKYRYTRVN